MGGGGGRGDDNNKIARSDRFATTNQTNWTRGGRDSATVASRCANAGRRRNSKWLSWTFATILVHLEAIVYRRKKSWTHIISLMPFVHKIYTHQHTSLRSMLIAFGKWPCLNSAAVRTSSKHNSSFVGDVDFVNCNTSGQLASWVSVFLCACVCVFVFLFVLCVSFLQFYVWSIKRRLNNNYWLEKAHQAR